MKDEVCWSLGCVFVGFSSFSCVVGVEDVMERDEPVICMAAVMLSLFNNGIWELCFF